jgi:gamma-glutamyltranspeptidase/glutathione hydrolase
MSRLAVFTVILLCIIAVVCLPGTNSQAMQAGKGVVVSASAIASDAGAAVLRDGGNAMDAAVATAFALAVTLPAAGNIGGGGFIVYRQASGEAVAYDFREAAPAGSSPTMFLDAGEYQLRTHHEGHRSVGVPGTVAGLHLAWTDRGSLPWERLVAPAIKLAADGFPVPAGLARSLRGVINDMRRYPASFSQFSRNGVPFETGDILRQPDLARTLQRISTGGPAGFYEGETALLIEKEMQAHGGLITRQDLRAYAAKRRAPVRGTYRGYEIISMPPPSSGGVALVEMLNILEGYNLEAGRYDSSQNVHWIAEAMRRAFADRAQHLGDPDFNPGMPVERLISKEYAAGLRGTINATRASKSSPTTFTWPAESNETTHLSVVDSLHNAAALTYTLEYSYGSQIVVPGGGFLLNNEMGDFNAGPGLTTDQGLIGTPPNLAEPRKRMLSSMTPTIVAKDGEVFMVTGSPGGRTIINTVLLTILNAVDFGMTAQETVDAGRFHHQWLPDRIGYESRSISTETVTRLRARGHQLADTAAYGAANIIVFDREAAVLQGAADRRQPDGGVAIE